MSGDAITDRIEAARKIAFRAGEILLGHLGRLAGYDEKSQNNLVTIADRESEAFIAGELRRLFPSDALCLEEADGKEGAIKRRGEINGAELAWCVDPLDGTTNFVHSHPVFAVSIGLLRRGHAVAGVVHAPAKRETFVGGEGIPPVLEANGAVIPLRVSSTPALARGLLATGFPPDRRVPGRLDALLRLAREALLSAHDLRRAGAAALDLCDLAAGRLDGFYEEGLAPWDLAAGQAILEAAGGRITRYDGAHHDVFSTETLASNGRIHPELMDMIRRAAL